MRASGKIMSAALQRLLPDPRRKCFRGEAAQTAGMTIEMLFNQTPNALTLTSTFFQSYVDKGIPIHGNRGGRFQSLVSFPYFKKYADEIRFLEFDRRKKGGKMSWTDERVSLLKQLWGEGKTAAEIAKVLGDGITRNAVIGKAHRLRLSSRLSPIQQNTGKKTKSEAPVARLVKPVPLKAVEFKGKGVKMIDLNVRMCRWPVGDPKDENFSFCGCDSVAGLPYCEDHARAAYQVPTRTRVLQAEDFEVQAGSPADFDLRNVSNG
jgi:GcrA cell cycle regulator